MIQANSFSRLVILIILVSGVAHACSDTPISGSVWKARVAITTQPLGKGLHPIDPVPVAIEMKDGIPEISEQDARLLLIGWTRPAFPVEHLQRMTQEVQVAVRVLPDGTVAEVMGLKQSDKFVELLRRTIVHWKFRPHQALVQGFTTIMKFEFKATPPDGEEIDLGGSAIATKHILRRAPRGRIPRAVSAGVSGCDFLMDTYPRLPLPRIEVAQDVPFSDAMVVVWGLVDQDGNLHQESVISSPDPGFDRSALDLARYHASRQHRTQMDFIMNVSKPMSSTTFVYTFHRSEEARQ